MKAPLLNLRRRGAFTLIELLVVIAIIALLASLGVVGGQIVIRKARELQARTAMKGLEIAIKGYRAEYHRMPGAEVAGQMEDNEPFDTSDALLLTMLLATEDKWNPKQIRFWEPPPAKDSGGGYSEDRGLIDPWGRNGYLIVLDFNGDGKIANPYAGNGEPEDITSDVLIYCAGANTVFEENGSVTGKKADDVKSWDY